MFLDTKAEKFEDTDMYILYNIILMVAALFVVPYFLLKIIFTGKYRQSLVQKLGGRQTKMLADLKDGRGHRRRADSGFFKNEKAGSSDYFFHFYGNRTGNGTEVY
jgi:hypothetical protein